MAFLCLNFANWMMSPKTEGNLDAIDLDLDGPVTLVQCSEGAEALIVKIARVSSTKAGHDVDFDSGGAKLLKYLIDHKHFSPFEHSFLTVRIETELDIAAQICRHRSMTFQQFSCRYSKTRKAEVPAFRRQDTKNRQNSFDDLHPEVIASAQETTEALFDQAYNTYERLLSLGIAKETARRVLPVATPTVLYMSGSVRSFIHYIQVRAHPDTQLEHRLVADQIKRIFCWKFPITAEALGWAA